MHYRVVTAQLNHETHSFNPVPTREEDFVVERGLEVMHRNEHVATALGGIIRASRRRGVELIASMAARARPGGPVEEQFFNEFVEALLRTIEESNPDAVCLDLHGSVATPSVEDCEGAVLKAVRDRFPSLPIATALDLDGQVTSTMVQASDLLIGYKTNPHSDIAETGEKTLNTLIDCLESSNWPSRVFIKLPFLLQGRIATATPPLAPIYARAASLESNGILDVSIFNGHQFLDITECGQSIIVNTIGDAQTALARCEELAAMLWNARGQFTEPMPSLGDVFTEIARAPRTQPFAIGDFGDRVLAAAPGDSTDIIRFVRERHPDLRGATIVFDPAAVSECVKARVGSRIRLKFGGMFTPGMPTVQDMVRVKSIHDGDFVNKGPYMAAVTGRFGQTAVVELGNLTVILTSKSPMAQDPAAYESFGIAVAEQAFVVAKSAMHFRLNFDGVAKPIVASTHGLTTFALRELPFRRAQFYLPTDTVPDAVVHRRPTVYPPHRIAPKSSRDLY